MQVGIFEPQFDSTGVFPSKGLAGDTVCMLVRGVDKAKGDKASLTMCGKPCGTVADATQEAFLAAWNAGGLLPNGQADPDAPAWITEVPFGVYDAQPLFCAAPDCPAGSNAPMPQCPNAPICPSAPMLKTCPTCPAGSNDIVVNVQGAGFAQPLQWKSKLEVTAVAPAGMEVPLPAASTGTSILLTIAGGANVTISGKGFGSDAAQMVAKLTTPSGGSVPCVVTSTSYASLTCTTGAALVADAGLQPTLVVEVHDTP